MEPNELTEEERQLIEERRKKAQDLNAAENFPITVAADVSVEAKVAAYDELHAFAKSVWDEKKSQGHYDEDTSHYAFEALMQLLAPEERTGEFWKAFNKLGE